MLDKTPFLLLLVSAAVFILFASLQGCDLRTFVAVDVPPGVESALSLPADSTTLADGENVVEEWRAYVTRESQRLDEALGDSYSKYEIVESLTSMGFHAAAEGVGGLPGGALITSGLALVAGLFIPKPGSARELQKEKEDSYNAGIEVGRDE